MKRYLILMVGFCMASIAMPSYAQYSDYENAVLGHSMEARMGLTIPFGGDQKKAHSKPQLMIGLRHDYSQIPIQDWIIRPTTDVSNVKEFNLSLTLDSHPTLLINNDVFDFGIKPLEENYAASALDTYDKSVLTVIGVSLVVIASSILVLS